MTYDTIRASGNNQYGQMTDTDRANFGSAQQAQDFILRKRLQDEALARTDGNEAARIAAEQAMQQRALAAQREESGTFAEKGAQAENLAKMASDRAYGLADRQNAPLMREQDFREKNYNDEHFLDHFINQAIQQASGGSGGDIQGQLPGEPKAVPSLSSPGMQPGPATRPLAANAPTTGGNGVASIFQDPSFLKQIVRGKLGMGQDPEETFRRALKQKIDEKMIDAAATETDPEKQSQAVKYLHDNGLDEFAGVQGTLTPDLATQDAKSKAALESYKTSPDYQFKLDDVLRTATEARNGRASPADVAEKRDAMVADLVKRRVSPETAKAVINQELDRLLPGLGRDILSGISSVAASVVDPSVWTGQRDPNRLVGQASATRSALGL